ncbi:MAG TPA: hypothetical protein VLZ05_04050, partial [Mycobacterium sp.]|nr:hypothetical protein [Mycobacterium sp.]
LGICWDSGCSEFGGCLFALAFVDLGGFVLGAGNADLQAFDFTKPALPVGHGYARFDVIPDLKWSGPL